MDIVKDFPDSSFPCPFHRTIFLSEIVPQVTGGENLSFAIVENGRPLAVVPFFTYWNWGVKYGKMSPLFCSGPAFNGEFSLNKKVKIALFAREVIRQRIREQGLGWVQFRQNVFSQPPFRSLDLGYMVADLALSARSLVVEVGDLGRAFDKMESQSRGAIRKAGDEGASIEIRPYATAEDAAWISQMRGRVYTSKGYEVRVGADLQYCRSLTRLEGSYLFTARNRNAIPVAYALVHLWSSFAYYSSGGVVRDQESPTGVGNLLHWEVMRFLHQQGVRWYDMSHSGLLSENTDRRKVAEFKRSLGAEEYPYLKGLVFRGGILGKFLARSL